jgi:hypothetical protein
MIKLVRSLSPQRLLALTAGWTTAPARCRGTRSRSCSFHALQYDTNGSGIGTSHSGRRKRTPVRLQGAGHRYADPTVTNADIEWCEQPAGAPWKVAQVESSLVVTLFGDREMTGVQRQPSGGATWVRISSRTWAL